MEKIVQVLLLRIRPLLCRSNISCIIMQLIGAWGCGIINPCHNTFLIFCSSRFKTIISTVVFSRGCYPSCQREVILIAGSFIGNSHTCSMFSSDPGLFSKVWTVLRHRISTRAKVDRCIREMFPCGSHPPIGQISHVGPVPVNKVQPSPAGKWITCSDSFFEFAEFVLTSGEINSIKIIEPGSP